MLNAVPVLLRIPGLPGKVFPKVTEFMDSLDKMLIEHKKTWDPAQPPRDLTDAFLTEIEKVRTAIKMGTGFGLKCSVSCDVRQVVVMCHLWTVPSGCMDTMVDQFGLTTCDCEPNFSVWTRPRGILTAVSMTGTYVWWWLTCSLQGW